MIFRDGEYLFFPLARLFKKTYDFVYRKERAVNAEKAHVNGGKVYTKNTCPFCGQSVLFSVFQNIANIAIKQFAQRFKVFPRNSDAAT